MSPLGVSWHAPHCGRSPFLAKSSVQLKVLLHVQRSARCSAETKAQTEGEGYAPPTSGGHSGESYSPRRTGQVPCRFPQLRCCRAFDFKATTPMPPSRLGELCVHGYSTVTVSDSTYEIVGSPDQQHRYEWYCTRLHDPVGLKAQERFSFNKRMSHFLIGTLVS
jgi:hypothetical protein